jgi:hypothetical protein
MIVNIGTREFASGLTFTALSRAKRLTDIAFALAPDFSRFQKCGTGPSSEARVDEEKRLRLLASETKERYTHILEQLRRE